MKITREQWDSLPQLDRIEIRQKSIWHWNIPFYIIILSTIYFTSGSILFGWIWLGIFLWMAFINTPKKINEIYSEYFEVQVKRKKREVNK